MRRALPPPSPGSNRLPPCPVLLSPFGLLLPTVDRQDLTPKRELVPCKIHVWHSASVACARTGLRPVLHAQCLGSRAVAGGCRWQNAGCLKLAGDSESDFLMKKVSELRNLCEETPEQLSAWRTGRGPHTLVWFSGSQAPCLPRTQVLGVQKLCWQPAKLSPQAWEAGALLGWSPDKAPLLCLSACRSARLSPAQGLPGKVFKCGRPTPTPLGPAVAPQSAFLTGFPCDLRVPEVWELQTWCHPAALVDKMCHLGLGMWWPPNVLITCPYRQVGEAGIRLPQDELRVQPGRPRTALEGSGSR